MKKILSLIIGIIALSGIIGITVYTLNSRGVRRDVVNSQGEVIELVSSNFNGNVLAELYNVYLNGQRHKIKFEYKVQLEKELNEGFLELLVYFDGGNIINENIISKLDIEDVSAEEVFSNEDINNIKLNIDDIQIIKIEDKDYILLEINCYGNYNKSFYFLFDDLGDLLVPNGAVIKDESVYYITDLQIFYDDSEQILAKYEDGQIYVLEPLVEEDKISLVECKYYYEDGKAKRDVLNTYEDIKIAE